MLSIEKVILRGAELRLKNGMAGLGSLVVIGTLMTVLGGDGSSTFIRNMGGLTFLYLAIQGLFHAPIQFRLSALFGLTRTMQFAVEVVLALIDVTVVVLFNYCLYRLSDAGILVTSFTYEDGLASWMIWFLAGLALHLVSSCLGILLNKFPWKKALMTYSLFIFVVGGSMGVASAFGVSDDHILAMFQWAVPLLEVAAAHEALVLGGGIIALLGLLYGLMRRHESLPFGSTV